MAKVKIKNISSYDVLITLPNVRYRRDLRPGQTSDLADDVFEEFNFDPGCRAYVRNGFIKVITEDETIKETLEVAPENIDLDVDDLLKNKPIAEFAQIMKTASDSLKNKIVDRAMALSITDVAHNSVIKACCGVDILAALALQNS